MGAKQRHDSQKVAEPLAGENADLEIKVHAYAARASQLHARLMATLDKLDALQLRHDEELAAEKRLSDALTRRLERYQRYIKESRAEWDDTREALSIVIEKGEFPIVSGMKVARIVDHAQSPNVSDLSSRPVDWLIFQRAYAQTPVQSYARAVIVSLRDELEQERRAHAQTRARADAEILTLSARLATREAQLEAYNLATPGSRANRGTAQGPSIAAEQQPPAEGRPEGPLLQRAEFSLEDTVHIIELTDARNRELEGEVRLLRQSFNQARLSRLSAPVCEESAQAENKGNDGPGMSDALPEYKREDPNSVETVALEFAPSHTRPRSTPPAPNILPTDSQASGHGVVVGRIAPDCQGSSGESDTLVSRGTALEQLRQLVDIFASQLDGFSAERNALKTALAAKEKDPQRGNGETSLQNNVFEGDDECHRLQATVSGLTRELNALRESSQARETQLQRELDMMRLEVSRMASRESTTVLLDPEATARVDVPFKNVPPGTFQGTQSSQKSNILDEGETECSMELATPLQPTILSVRDDISDLGGAPSHSPNPSLVPLPPSPDIPTAPLTYGASTSPQSSPQPLLPSIFLSSPLRDPPAWWPHPQSPYGLSSLDTDASRRLEVIERELLFARQELAAKNEELEELREVVDQLRELVYADIGNSDHDEEEARGE